MAPSRKSRKREAEVHRLVSQLLASTTIFDRPKGKAPGAPYSLDNIRRGLPPVPVMAAERLARRVADLAVPFYGIDVDVTIPKEAPTFDAIEVYARVLAARRGIAELIPLANNAAERRRLRRLFEETESISEALLPVANDHPAGEPKTPQRQRFLKEVAGVVTDMLEDVRRTSPFKITNDLVACVMEAVLVALAISGPADAASLATMLSRDWKTKSPKTRGTRRAKRP